MAATFTGIRVSGVIRLTEVPTPAPTDLYPQYTVLQLPGTGTNNTANNTFLDSSSNNFTVTRFGNTTQGSFSPFSTAAGYWSNYFDGSTDWLSLPSGSMNFMHQGSVNWTFETWFFPTSTTYQTLFSTTGSSAQVGFNIFINNSSAGQVGLAINRGSSNNDYRGVTEGGLYTFNTWNHLAITFNGTNKDIKIYINGISQSVTISGNATFSSSSATNTPDIGRFVTVSVGPGGYFTGYISNLRVVQDLIYTTSFTPSTTPLTAITNTSILTCQSNRFIDNSANNFAITRSGDVSVSAFGPFAAASSYNAATMGGSAYFDGSGDYLSVPYNNNINILSGDFTVESWINLSTTKNTNVIASSWSQGGLNSGDGWIIYTDVNNRVILNWAAFSIGSSFISSSNNAISVGTWNHIAVTRSGNNFTIWINGVSVATGTNSGTNTSQYKIDIGFYGNGSASLSPTSYFSGYISNLRIVKGTAVYTSNFTPPTAPVTAISGTSLLLNGTNGAIYDASTKNVLETLGDAKVSTTVSANGSMYFDGNGDYLLVLSNPMFGFGVGDFTIEAWVYPTANPTNGIGTIADFRTGATTSASTLRINNSRQLMFYNGPANIETTFTSQTVALNAWSHIAYVRSSNTVYGYVNGQLAGSVAVSSNLGSNQPVLIGINNAPGYAFNGYMNNLRITKGIARYTTNFTPPTRS